MCQLYLLKNKEYFLFSFNILKNLLFFWTPLFDHQLHALVIGIFFF